MTLDDGSLIEADKNYVVSGWATVGAQAPGRPVWEVVAEYLRLAGTVKLAKLNIPKVHHVENNPGMAGELIPE